MEQRRSRRRRKQSFYQRNQIAIFSGVVLLVVLGIALYVLGQTKSSKSSDQVATSEVTGASSIAQSQSGTHTARIMAHGDLLYHEAVYRSAKQADGSYDFTENFTYVTPWIQQADLAIADFEGTIAPDLPLAGYPLFNAPAATAQAIQAAGYDVVDLAHNHILDSYLSGLVSTAQTFANLGVATVGVYPEGNRTTAPLLIKEVNGIKIAILAYAYGFNGMEESLTADEQASYLSDMNEQQMQVELAAAEKEADITIVMPQMGVEYQLEPTQEQQTLYRKMVEWGADIVFGGHPHVTEPAEIIEKDGDRKLIIYSMGNFLSNQRIESMDDTENSQWTERGVLMDVTIEKKDGKTTIQTAQAHPTWVNRVDTGVLSDDGLPTYHYQTYILEDFIEGGAHRDLLDDTAKARIDTAYQEMNQLVGLQW